MTLAPLVVYHTALSRGLVCYYEQAERGRPRPRRRHPRTADPA